MDTKICFKCKKVKAVSEFYKDKNRKDGYRCWCRVCEANENKIREPLYKEKRRKWRTENKEQYRKIKKLYYENNKVKILSSNKQWSQTLHGKFISYKRSAKQRDIDFLLSEDEFAKFWKISCHYCGANIETIGIDRLDSSEPYILKNVVPCCSTCNTMKGSMNYENFIQHITMILKFIGDKNENN